MMRRAAANLNKTHWEVESQVGDLEGAGGCDIDAGHKVNIGANVDDIFDLEHIPVSIDTGSWPSIAAWRSTHLDMRQVIGRHARKHKLLIQMLLSSDREQPIHVDTEVSDIHGSIGGTSQSRPVNLVSVSHYL
jgi:hypothetical protein